MNDRTYSQLDRPHAHRNVSATSEAAQVDLPGDIWRLQRLLGNAAVARLAASNSGRMALAEARRQGHPARGFQSVLRMLASEQVGGSRAGTAHTRQFIGREAGGHSPGETAEHAAHLAHEGHLVAEGVEGAGHALHKAHKYVSHVQAARELQRGHGQMAQSLRLMRREITALQNRLAKSGGGAKVAAQLKAAEANYQAALAAFEEERAAVAAASEVVAADKAVQASTKGSAMARLGRAARAFEAALGSSSIGRGLLQTGRLVASPKFVQGMMALGAILSGVHSYLDSTARTGAGKALNAGLGAGGGALTMANPWVALGDLVAPKGFKLSEIYHGTAGALANLAEGAVTGSTEGLEEFHERSKAGDYGKVMGAASEAGDFWAEKGLAGGLSEFGSEAWSWLTD